MQGPATDPAGAYPQAGARSFNGGPGNVPGAFCGTDGRNPCWATSTNRPPNATPAKMPPGAIHYSAPERYGGARVAHSGQRVDPHPIRRTRMQSHIQLAAALIPLLSGLTVLGGLVALVAFPAARPLLRRPAVVQFGLWLVGTWIPVCAVGWVGRTYEIPFLWWVAMVGVYVNGAYWPVLVLSAAIPGCSDD